MGGFSAGEILHGEFSRGESSHLTLGGESF